MNGRTRGITGTLVRTRSDALPPVYTGSVGVPGSTIDSQGSSSRLIKWTSIDICVLLGSTLVLSVGRLGSNLTIGCFNVRFNY